MIDFYIMLNKNRSSLVNNVLDRPLDVQLVLETLAAAVGHHVQVDHGDAEALTPRSLRRG